MRWSAPVLVLLILTALAIPAAAEDVSRIGYVSFKEVTIQLHNEDARVEVEYTLDPGMTFILFFFGTGDLQKKVERSLNFPLARAEVVALDHAVFTLDSASENYGDRAYWFSPHTFGITFPRVTVRTPGSTVTMEKARAIPRGFGYFGDTG